MAQFTQCLGLNLTNTLASNMEFFTDLFQSPAATIIKTEAQLEHFALAFCQAFKHIFYLFLQELMASCIRWSKRGMIFDEVTQVAIFFLADRRLQTDRFLAHLDDLANLFRANFHLLCDFLGRGFTAKIL